MPSKAFQDIPFPLAGIEEYRALTNGRVFNGKTSAAATQSAENVRGIDPFSGRARGASRPGTTKFFPTAINGTESIQDIVALIGAASDALDFTGILLAARELRSLLVHPVDEGTTLVDNLSPRVAVEEVPAQQ